MPPPRDPAVRDPAVREVEPRAAGTATLRGRVVDGVTGQPIARAIVTAFGRGIPDAPIKTDEQGGFEFTQVGAGGVSIRASKTGYLPGQLPAIGQSLRARAGLAIADGQSLVLTLRLYRTAAISGRIVDDFGDPVERASVELFSASRGSWSSNNRGPLAFDASNEVGEFRVGKLPAGRYILAVKQETPPDFDGAPVGADEPSSGYPMTYYPGVTSLDEAELLTLAPGQRLSGIEIALSPVAKTRVTGIVTSAKGGPLESIQVRLVPAQSNSNWKVHNDATVVMEPGGKFRANVPPGDYDLFASALPRPVDVVPDGVRRHPEFARMRLTVGGASLQTKVLTSPVVTITGRLVFDGSSPPPHIGRGRVAVISPVPGREDECRITGPTDVQPDGTFTVDGVWGVCRVPTDARVGTWRVHSVRAGGEDITHRAVDFTNGAAPSDLQVTLTDRFTSLAFDVTSESGPTRDFVALVFSVDKGQWGADGTVYTLTPPLLSELTAAGAAPGRAVALSGAVTGAGTGGGAGTRGAGGVAPPIARRVMTTFGQIAGSFYGAPERDGPRLSSMSELRAGDYFAVALDDLDEARLATPAVFEALAAIATRVTLADGERRTLTLRRQRAPTP